MDAPPPYGRVAMEFASLPHGVELAFHSSGAGGTPVLLIMGYCVPGRAWRFQWPELAKSRQVVFFDNRGVGQTQAPAGPWSMEDLSRDALGLMDHLGWERAHVVGVSMGGMIAQHVALRAPDRVASLALIATQAGGLKAVVPTARGARSFLMANLGRSSRRGHRLADLLFPTAFIEHVGRDWVERILNEDFNDVQGPASRRWQLAAVLRHQAAPQLHRIAGIPTLIVRPGADLLVRPQESDRLAELLPQSVMLSLPDAGHGVIRQCADQVNAALATHFARAEAP